jgi:hypothetical protein
MRPEKRRLLRRWQGAYILGILVVTLPYWITFTSQLCSDDFILLYHYGRRAPWHLWAFFDPHTIWTWHPLQHLSFSISWRLSGIEPWAYRAASLAFHFGAAYLLLRLGYELTDSIHIGGCSAVLFAGHWRPWEAVAWAASIATLQSTFFALLACLGFVRYLHWRKRGDYVLMLAAGFWWALSKETVIQLPPALLAIYLYWLWYEPTLREREDRFRHQDPEPPVQPPALREGGWRQVTLLLAPAALLTTVYLLFYWAAVRDVYTLSKTGYDDLAVAQWPSSLLEWFQRIINPLMGNEVIRDFRLSRFARWLEIKHIPAVAVLIGTLIAFMYRRRFPLFALALLVISAIPYLAMPFAYATSRYSYGVLPAGLFLAVGLGAELWRMTERRPGGWRAWVRIGVAAVGSLYLVLNFLQLYHTMIQDRQANQIARETYDFLSRQNPAPGQPVVFIFNTINRHMDGHDDVPIGWGLIEMARLATGNDGVLAAAICESPGETFTPDVKTMERIKTCPNWYVVQYTPDGWRSTLMERRQNDGGLRIEAIPTGHSR